MKPLSLLQNLLRWFTGRNSLECQGNWGGGSCWIKVHRVYQGMPKGWNWGLNKRILGFYRYVMGCLRQGPEVENRRIQVKWGGMSMGKRREGGDERGLFAFKQAFKVLQLLVICEGSFAVFDAALKASFLYQDCTQQCRTKFSMLEAW